MEPDQPSTDRQAEPQPWVNPTPSDRYDLAVIGAQPEAVVAARAACRRHRRVALILPTEPARPTVAGLQAAARLLRHAAEAASLCQGQPRPREASDRDADGEFAALVHRAQQAETDAGRRLGAQALSGTGIDVFCGNARFVAPDGVEVEGARVGFRRAILATGGGGRKEELEAAHAAGFLTEESLLELTCLPGRLAIVGVGPSQCAWAQTFRRLGSQVHLLGRHAAILPDEHPEAAQSLQARLAAEGVCLHLGCDDVVPERAGKSHAVLIRRGQRREKLFADHVLVECPRRPRVEGLDLATAGVACSEQGVLVEDTLRTSNRRVFAVGEVCGPEFSSPPAAETMARLAVRNALGWTARRFNRLLVPRCVDTDPQVVRIGLTAQQAAVEQLRVNTYRAEMSEAHGAVSDRQEAGFAEVYVRGRSGRVVGATIVAHQAAEWIGPLMLLMAQHLPLAALAGVIPCYPTRLELLRRLARQCQQAQPPHCWSVPVEWVETTWRRLRKRWEGK